MMILSIVYMMGLLACSESEDTASVESKRAPFACGDQLCSGEEYCFSASGGAQSADTAVGNSSDEMRCVAVPETCPATPDCNCLSSVCDYCFESEEELSCSVFYQ